MDAHPPHSSTAYFFTKSGSFIVNINEKGKLRDKIKAVNRSNSTPSGTAKSISFDEDSNETNFATEATTVDFNGGDPVHHKHATPSQLGTHSRSGTNENVNGHAQQDNTESPESSDTADEDDDKEKTKLKFSKLPARSKYTFFMLAIANFGAGCGFSLMAPFFPREAEKKGASTTVVGLVFSSFQLVNFIASPVIGNYLTRIGAKFVYTSGIMVAGSTSILFGFLDQGPSGTVFVAMSFLVRSVEALGVSAFSTASFAIISNEFPNHIASVFATLETCVGIGLMIGPTIGGALYEVGGFGMPFWLVGAIMIVSGLAIFTCLPQPKDMSKNREGTVFSLLRSPLVWVTLLCVMVGSCGLGFMDPTLSNHLDQFGLSTLYVGLFFVIVPGIYAILAPLWGFISDSKDIQSPLLFGGSLVSAIGFLFMGPSPILPFLPRELWTVTLGLVFYGLSVGCTIVPTMKCMVLGARELGLADNLNTFGLVSGLFNSIFCLGAFIGPTIGGALVDQIGFYYGSTIIAAFYLVAMIVTGIFFGLRRLRKKKSSLTEKSLSQDKKTTLGSAEIPFSEKSPLLPENSKAKTFNSSLSM